MPTSGGMFFTGLPPTPFVTAPTAPKPVPTSITLPSGAKIPLPAFTPTPVSRPPVVVPSAAIPGLTDAPSPGAPGDPLDRLGTLFAGAFGNGAGGGREPLIAVPVGAGADGGSSGSSSGVLVLVGLVVLAAGGYYWYTHRKGATP